MYRNILWDNDGVLVDTEPWYFKATQRALAEAGFALAKSSYLEIMAKGESSWDLARQSGVGDSTIAAKIGQRDAYYQEYLKTEYIQIPNVLEILRKLAESYRMAIVTTSRRHDFDLIHKKKDIIALMDLVLTREDYSLSKPDPEPYLLALSKLGAEACDTIVVEDSQRGLQSALAAGIDCIIVHNDFTAGHDFTGATHRIKSLTELPALMG